MSTILFPVNILLLIASLAIRAEELKKFSFVAKHPFGRMNFTDTESYIDLLKGDFYIDKSMLISVVVKFDKYKVIAIHIPSKWGKTVNLDMIKRFLEIPVDLNGRQKSIENTSGYRLFHNGEIIADDGEIEHLKRPLLISTCKEILNQHLGQYPVIYLNFENLVASSYNNLIRQIGKRIKNAYEDHPYIERVIRGQLENTGSLNLKKIPFKRLTRYLDAVEKTLTTDDDIVKSVEVLTEILFWIHGSRRAYVLVDNYDGILLGALSNSAVSDEDAGQLLNLFAYLLSMFQTNAFQSRVVFMGTFPLLETIRDLRSVKQYKALNNVLMQFYSISQDDVSLLFERLKIPSFIRVKALNWYNGYHWGKDLQSRIFGVASIAKFISTGRLDYRKERNTVIDAILDQILDSMTVRWFLLMRLYGQTWRVLPKVQRGMSSTNFLDLKRYLIGTKTEAGIFICFPLEPFIRSMGSLSITSLLDRDISMSDSFMIHIMVASNEARMELAEKIINYYSTRHNISSDVVERGVRGMAECLNDRDTNCTGFLESIEYLSRKVSLIDEMIQLRKVHGVTPTIFMSCILHYIGLRLSLAYDFAIESVDHEVTEWEELTGWSKVILITAQRVIIVEVQVCSSVVYIVDAAKREYEKNPRYSTFKQIQFVGVDIAANGSATLRSEVSTGSWTKNYDNSRIADMFS